VSSRDVGARITRRIRRAGLALPPGALEALESYVDLLRRWNRRINLTALSVDPLSDEAVDRLLIEPIAACRHVLSYDHKVIDIGSGSGSPSIPLKICLPRLNMILVEVKVRKTAFLREVVRQLRLTDVEVENRRFEELLPRAELHEAADLITFRAVRADRRLWTGIQAFLRPSGRVFWFGATPAATGEMHLPFELVSIEPLSPGPGSQMAVLRKLRTG
jgi:16S rRNA (guanine527-N7)-methyltransferase